MLAMLQVVNNKKNNTYNMKCGNRIQNMGHGTPGAYPGGRGAGVEGLNHPPKFFWGISKGEK